MADGSLDLFGDPTPAELLAGVRRYVSGVAAPAIWAGFAAAGAPMCLVVAGLAASGVRRAAEYARAGGALLLDSGAFIHRAQTSRLDWQKVIASYLAIADSSGAPISMILPDVVGDQAASLDLARSWGPPLARLADGGHELLVPMQRGSMPLQAFLDAYIGAVGFTPAGLAVPSHTAAMPLAQVRQLPALTGIARRVHFLGISRRSANLAGRVLMLRSGWPDVVVSADACEHRAHVGQGRRITVDRARCLPLIAEELREQVDDTEDEAWGEAQARLRALFPDADEDTLSEISCSSWGVAAFDGVVAHRIQEEAGPLATTRAIERFARESVSA